MVEVFLGALVSVFLMWLVFGLVLYLTIKTVEDVDMNEKLSFKEAFEKNSIKKKISGSRYIIKCPKGRWSTIDRDEAEAIRKAVALYLPYYKEEFGDLEDIDSNREDTI